MFGFGIGELLVILVIVMIVFGAGRLPEIGEGLGRGIRNFRKQVKAPDGRFDLEELARRTGRVVVHDELHGLWAVGPEANAPVLSSTELPHLSLEDRAGNRVDLRTFLGRRMVIHAWAPW